MKRILLFILCIFGISSYAQPSNYAIIAEFDNAYGNTTVFSDGAAGSNIRSATILANSADDEYVIEWDSFNNKWQNGATPYNSEFTLTHGLSGSPNGFLTVPTTSGNYYTFQINGLAYSNRSAVVMETDNTPVNFAAANPVSTVPSYVTPGNALNLTVNMAGAKSAQERVFLRYSTDGFTTSDVEEVSFATATASSGTISIPSSVNTGGNTVEFYLYSTTVAATASSNHDLITLNLENNSGANYSYEVAYHLTGTSTSWNNSASWVGGVIPPSGSVVIINEDINLDINADLSDLTIQSGVTFTASDGSNAYELTISGDLTNNGTFTASDGKVIFDGAGTVSGTVVFNNVDNTSGGRNFGTSATVNGTFSLQGGAVITNPPTFASGSTMEYNGLSAYSAGESWYQNLTSGQGVPHHVSLVGNTNLDFGADDDFRQCNGNFTIEDGSSLTLSTATGGDLRIGDSGNWINNNTTVGAGFISNNRAIRFVGNTDQNMSNASGTTTVGYLLNEKPSGRLILDNNIVLDGTGATSAPVLQLLNSGDLDLNNFSITIAGDQERSIEVNGARSLIGNGSLIFEGGTGNAAVVQNISGTLNIGSGIEVTIHKGVDFGNHTTIDGRLILENSSFCANNSPTYGSTATLEYAAGNYNTGNEWVAGTSPGVGVPNSVVLNMDAGTDRLTIDGTSSERTVPADLTVTSGGITIDDNNTLTVGDAITNNGTIEVQDGCSLVQTGTGPDGNVLGSGTYNVWRSKVFEDYRRFVFISSPVSGATLGGAFPNSNTSDFYSYDPSSQSFASHGAAVAMEAGRGYTATPKTNTTGASFVQVTDTATFSSGTINNGDITYSAGTVNPFSAGNDNGFVLAGNPYPSAIDAGSFLTANSGLVQTIWLWDHQSPNINDADYATWTNAGGVVAYSGGTSPNGNIATGQAFMVQPNSNPTASLDINFTNAMRVVGGNTQLFKTETRERFWVNLTKDTSASSQILIALMDDALETKDRNDGRKFKASQVASFYSKIDGDDYAIQALPKFSQSNSSRIIPLGVDAWETGDYVISLDSLNNWQPGHNIYLVDSFNQLQIDLNRLDYRFTVNNSGSIQNRFYLMIDNASVGLGELEAKAVVWGYAQNGGITIRAFGKDYQLAQAQLLSLSGQSLAVQTYQQRSESYFFKTPDLPQGVYLLQMQNQKGEVVTQKIILN